MNMQCILEVKDVQEARAGTIITVGVVQSAECSFSCDKSDQTTRDMDWWLEEDATSVEKIYIR